MKSIKRYTIFNVIVAQYVTNCNKNFEIFQIYI